MFSWLPENISTYGPKIDGIIHQIWTIVFVWFVAAELILFYFLFRYRRKTGKKAAFLPGRGKAALWILIPAIFVLGFDLSIDVAQTPVWNEVKVNMPEDIVQTINIEGQQFVWNFTLPGKDNKLGTPDDIKTVNQLYVPIHTKIGFNLASKDVLHSFWVPEMRLKQDAVPGRIIKGWFEVIKEGTYVFGCAELCGSGHGTMKGQLHVLKQTDYEKWVKENTPKPPPGAAAPQGDNS